MRKTLGEYYGSLPARIGLGCVAMIAIASSLPVAADARFSLEKAAAVVVAWIAWLWSEVKSHDVSPHPQDVALFRTLAGQLVESAEFLRSHDFGNSFRDSSMKPFFNMVDSWSGPKYHFTNTELEAHWINLYAAIQSFTRLVTDYCGPLPPNYEILSVKTLVDFERGGRSEQTLKAASDINAAADNVVSSWDEFAPLATKRLKTAI